MVMARGHHARNDDAKLLQNLLEACGQCIEVPESYVDIHTGLSGSGVAFVSIVFTHIFKDPALKISESSLGASSGSWVISELSCLRTLGFVEPLRLATLPNSGFRP